MFSKNAYIFPHASTSSHPSRASVIGLNGSEFLLHHHHHEMFPGHLNAAAAALYDQEICGGCGGGGVDPSAAVNPARPTKKDRHSKITTAQGTRDRRVRLSIGVARKFFDLQEILGFDKPSKTLDWLLTKSKSAINDLEQLRAKAGADDEDSECEVESKQKSAAENKAKIGASLAKDSRVKARARARERTREKMKLNETSRNNNELFINNSQRKISASAASTGNINLGFREAMLHCHPTFEAATNEDLIQELLTTGTTFVPFSITTSSSIAVQTIRKFSC